MSTPSTSYIEKWYKIKENIAELEKKCERYKKKAEKDMVESGKNSVTDGIYEVKRVQISRQTVSKKTIPSDIWNRYSKETQYQMYRVIRNNM